MIGNRSSICSAMKHARHEWEMKTHVRFRRPLPKIGRPHLPGHWFRLSEQTIRAGEIFDRRGARNFFR